MAIYTNFATNRRTRADEVGIDIRAVQGPPLPQGPLWGDALLYYWAQQINFVDDVGAGVGGGHIGIQAYDNWDLATKRTVVNWGVYDDIIGGGAVFRSSAVLTPDVFDDINNPVSMGMDWDYGDWLRFRVFRSPKQDWTADEIFPGTGQVPPYVGTDQQPDEVAFRCTIENLTRGTVPIAFHDALIKNAAASKPMTNGQFWTEPIAQASYPGDIDNDWPWDPICDFRNLVFDGVEPVTLFSRAYNVVSQNTDIFAVDASGGEPGYIRHVTAVSRVNLDDTTFAPPVGFWDTPQPNVAPNPDLTTPAATPRPWF
jgi:hypothetical protein